jgi:hypothetical protein
MFFCFSLIAFYAQIHTTVSRTFWNTTSLGPRYSRRKVLTGTVGKMLAVSIADFPRNRSMLLDIIKASDFENESAHAHNMEISKDQWFYQKKRCSCSYDQTDRMARGFQASRLQQVSLWRRFGMIGLWAMGTFSGGVLRRRRRWRRWSPEHRLAQSSLLSEDESR